MRQLGFSLFPFLSVQLGTMGVLSFLATLLALLQTPGVTPAKIETELKLVGAPNYVRPLLLECRNNGIWLHEKNGNPTRKFSLPNLQKEAQQLEILTEQVLQTLPTNASREQVWFALKHLIPQQPNLKNSFISWLHEVETSNLSGEAHSLRIQRYPILLIHTDGLESYEIASQLIEQSSRLAIGLEPFLPGWELPSANYSPSL